MGSGTHAESTNTTQGHESKTARGTRERVFCALAKSEVLRAGHAWQGTTYSEPTAIYIGVRILASVVMRRRIAESALSIQDTGRSPTGRLKSICVCMLCGISSRTGTGKLLARVGAYITT